MKHNVYIMSNLQIYHGGSYLNSLKRSDLLGQLETPKSKWLIMPVCVEDVPDYQNKTYNIRISGFTEYGTKVCFMITDIYPSIDVMVPKDTTNESFTGSLIDIFMDNNIEVHKIDTIYGYPLFGFNEQKLPYKRIYTKDLADRKSVLNLLVARGYTTANDDRSCYYRKVSRDYDLMWANWMEITAYLNYDPTGRYLTGRVDINCIKQYTGELTESLKKDKCLVMTFDIESYSDSNTGDVPMPDRHTDWIFMICASFHWGYETHESDAIYKVCIVDKEINPDPDIFTVVCGNEENIIKAFALLVYNMMPDFIIGFNDMQYDWNFIIERANQHANMLFLYNKMSLVPKTRSSNEYIYNRMVTHRDVKISPEERMSCKFLNFVGCIPIDMRVCFKRLTKKEEISQGSSLNFYLKMNNLDLKVDLPHTEMFKIYRNNDIPNMDIVRKYCVIDCISCFRLFAKQLILPTLRENANISYFTIFDENFCAISAKICNKVIADGLKRDILCSNLTQESSLTDKFSGAHVFHPEKGLETYRPIIPEDFKSLYPSIIMAYNISPERFVSTRERAEYLESRGHQLYYLSFMYAGIMREAWFVRHKSDEAQWGLIPKILKVLFASRVTIQKAQEKIDKNDPDGLFEYNRLEIKQKAIKVFMNSIYGVSGMDISPLFLLEQAVAITSTGKRLINEVATFVRNKGFFVKYGDSVASYTPIIIQHNKKIKIEKIENLSTIYGNNEWIPCIEDEEKELCILDDTYVWSDTGFTKVNHVIRHKLSEDKKMVRILTHTGIVDVTNDHSLLKENGDIITPNDLSVGDTILHKDFPKLDYSCNIHSVEEARILGFFFGDGSCGNYICNSGKKNSWALNNANMEFLLMYKNLCEIAYPEYNWVIMNTIDSSNVYKLSPRSNDYGGIVKLTKKYREMMYDGKAKKIPFTILNSSYEVRKSFWDGMYDADGDKNIHNIRIDQKNQVSAAGIAFLASTLGYKVSFNTRTDKQDIFRITCTMKKQRKKTNVIKKISDLIDYNDYVYDLTTANHHFAAGVGKIVVHNTDSVYLRPPDRYFVELDQEYQLGRITKLQYWTRMVEISDIISEEIRDEINEYLLSIVGNNCIKMENEEVKFPVIFTGKKKYAGYAHYHDKTGKLIVDFNPKKIFIRGIDIIKAGQPQVAITIGNKILRSIFDVNKPESLTVLDVVENVFNDAIKNKDQWSIDDFIQSDAYRPLKDNKTVKKFVERMTVRHQQMIASNQKKMLAGEPVDEYLYEPPVPGERFKYIVVKQLEYFDIRGRKINLNKGDLMEYVHVVRKLGLEIDIAEYLSSKVAGICARFINYHEKFQPENASDMTPKEVDEYAQKHAKKFLEKILEQYAAPKVNHHELKRAYKASEKIVKQQLGPRYELIQSLQELQNIEEINEIKKKLVDLATETVRQTKIEHIKSRNRQMLTMLGISNDGTDSDNKESSKNVFKYYKIIKNIIETNKQDIAKLLNRIDISGLLTILKKYNSSFENLVLLTRQADLDDDICLLDVDDVQKLEEFKSMFNMLIYEVERHTANHDLYKVIIQLRERRISSRS